MSGFFSNVSDLMKLAQDEDFQKFLSILAGAPRL